MADLERLSLTELIQLQTNLGEALKRRFERDLCLCFSDIVGSTEYFERFGDAAGRGLHQRHFDALAQARERHGGRLVDTAGDGAFVVFPTADQAAQAVIDLENLISEQNRNHDRDHQLQVRIGLHYGTVLTDGVTVSGEAVNFASRVCTSGGPDEIRLSHEIFRQLSTNKRVLCRGLGPVALKGVAEPQQLLLMEWRDRNIFPSLARVVETGEEITLPPQDTITFGRLKERNGFVANDVVLKLPDVTLTKSISRWHFELRRNPTGFSLRSVTNQITTIDDVPLPNGAERPIKPGSIVRVANVLSLEFLVDEKSQRIFDSTYYPP